jgi:hypothetical protein
VAVRRPDFFRQPHRAFGFVALAVAATGLTIALFVVTGTERADAGTVLAVTRTDDPAPNGCIPGDCSLREAVIAANTPPGGHTISVPAGTYTLTRAGVSENDAATGDLDVTEDMTIDGAGSSSTVIQVAQIGENGIDRIFQVFGGVTAIMNDLTLQHGDAQLESPPGDGGAISNAGTLSLSRMVLDQNVAEDGGAIVNNGTLTIADSRISGNIATDAGGGVQGTGPSNITITNSSISGNQASQAGGGMSVFGIMNVTGSTISGNTSGAQSGGAHLLGTANFTNSTISGNNALGFDGGGLLVGGTTTLTNVTIAGNSSGSQMGAQGGGIRVLIGSVTATNSIIASNPTGGDCAGTVTSQGHNIDSDDSCGLGAAGDQPGTNPLLVPLASGLGPTQTHGLQTGSPAIDLGNEVACPGTDQRGVARPLDGGGIATAVCDIGSFEAGPLDSDQDGCTDEREAQSLPNSQFSGGLRNFGVFWDFFDVPTGGSFLRDKSISAPDIFAVIGRFNAVGDSGIDPLSTPPPPPAYHTAYDRGSAVGDPWDLSAANGSIASTDIFAVIGQFNHSCE